MHRALLTIILISYTFIHMYMHESTHERQTKQETNLSFSETLSVFKEVLGIEVPKQH